MWVSVLLAFFLNLQLFPSGKFWLFLTPKRNGRYSTHHPNDQNLAINRRNTYFCSGVAAKDIYADVACIGTGVGTSVNPYCSLSQAFLDASISIGTT
mgnify:FL=1